MSVIRAAAALRVRGTCRYAQPAAAGDNGRDGESKRARQRRCRVRGARYSEAALRRFLFSAVPRHGRHAAAMALEMS